MIVSLTYFLCAVSARVCIASIAYSCKDNLQYFLYYLLPESLVSRCFLTWKISLRSTEIHSITLKCGSFRPAVISSQDTTSSIWIEASIEGADTTLDTYTTFPSLPVRQMGFLLHLISAMWQQRMGRGSDIFITVSRGVPRFSPRNERTKDPV